MPSEIVRAAHHRGELLDRLVQAPQSLVLLPELLRVLRVLHAEELLVVLAHRREFLPARTRIWRLWFGRYSGVALRSVQGDLKAFR